MIPFANQSKPYTSIRNTVLGQKIRQGEGIDYQG